MIKGYCRTNLDEYTHEEWPTEFVAVPRVGERVEAKSGRSLKVVEVPHKMGPRPFSNTQGPEPMIVVELHRGL